MPLAHPFIDVSPQVEAALHTQQAVVALESTLIAHGMPWPQNIETGQLLEDTIRKMGAVPATIAIISGRIKVGLSEAELELLAQNPQIVKVSRRDFSLVLSKGMHGATTVAGTMFVAAAVGIKVFATGGIGGVHRGAAESFDISADLTEMARSSVAVVSAGAKSILDLGLTLEYLETQGVPVYGYQTDSFPAFYTAESRFGVDARIDDAESLAHLLATKWQLGLEGGVLIANPIPQAFALPAVAVEEAITQAMEEATQAQISGKRITPFLLKRINELTGGLSLNSNIQLVLNNARLASEVAIALANCS